jgi:SAM-dependent methyltransferase
MAYTPDFFKALGASARRSVAIVAPLVMDLIHPQSVVDVGCGTGEWLAGFRQLGVEDVVGIDGAWVPRDQLQIPAEAFVERDLTHPFRLGRTFDLALSLEVAEHLVEHAADAFIASLIGLAPAILFSAAIPFQGGNAHVNEQWPSYWAAKFAIHDFEVVNCLRPHIWDNAKVESYYRQNLLLFVRHDRLQSDSRLRQAQEATRLVPIDVAHPWYFINAQIENVNLRRIPGGLWRGVKRAVRKRIH